MRIVCIGDTHGRHHALKLPEGDVLVHVGDGCQVGTFFEFDEFATWFGKVPGFDHKVMIGGNHDRCLELEPEESESYIPAHVHYLRDRAITIEGIKFYGSPWQPEFNNWAFNVKGIEIRRYWSKIPDDTDVLITHGPPMGILDATMRGVAAGCPHLFNRVMQIRPTVHVFGHIHEGYGELERDGIHFANCSNVNYDYKLTNQPIVIDLPERKGGAICNLVEVFG